VRLARDAGFPSRRRRRACSAGSTSASTPTAWPALLDDEGWLIAPGLLFHARRGRPTLMRVNFAAGAGRALLARAARRAQPARTDRPAALFAPMQGLRRCVSGRNIASPLQRPARCDFRIHPALGEPELMRASAFAAIDEELRRESETESLTRLSSLNPSLLQDLLRFEQNGRQSELLEVMAACRAPFQRRGGAPAAAATTCPR
jgi:hypothetical protein